MKLNQIEFDLTQFPDCCGAIVVSNFRQTHSGGFFDRDTTKKLPSLEDVFLVFEEDLDEKVAKYIEYDSVNKGGRYLLQASLVSKYGTTEVGQFPELAEHLLKTGWKVSAKWKNSNTGNEVTLYRKMLSNKKVRQLHNDYNGGYDNEDNGW